MITSALIYIPVASFSDRLERKPFVIVSFIFFTLFPVMLFYFRSNAGLILVFIVRGLKEFGEPTRKAMIMDMCPAHSKARTFGLYYFIRDFTVSFAAFFGGWLWKQGAEINFFAASLFGIAGTLIFLFFGKGMKK
ncbi:MAG TPA: MFS transporter [Bacteroidia bacterium]|nr:MFS transporter [Bacteroidia bacterium]